MLISAIRKRRGRRASENPAKRIGGDRCGGCCRAWTARRGNVVAHAGRAPPAGREERMPCGPGRDVAAGGRARRSSRGRGWSTVAADSDAAPPGSAGASARRTSGVCSSARAVRRTTRRPEGTCPLAYSASQFGVRPGSSRSSDAFPGYLDGGASGVNQASNEHPPTGRASERRRASPPPHIRRNSSSISSLRGPCCGLLHAAPYPKKFFTLVEPPRLFLLVAADPERRRTVSSS